MFDTLKFSIPALDLPVHTVVNGKRVVKRDEFGNVVKNSRIVPKGRPRSGINRKTGGRIVYTPEATVSFEKHIRRCFFDTYMGNYGVYNKGKAIPVHSVFMGCVWYGERAPCTRFRQGHDFMDCKMCRYRRKNLSLDLTVHIKDNKHMDLDNIIKVVLDSLNNTCYYDDTLFCIKTVSLIPYAVEEKLDVEISVVSPYIRSGSLIGGYDISNLSVDEARTYLQQLCSTDLADCWLTGEMDEFFKFVGRSDRRKAIQSFTSEIYLNKVTGK